MSTQVLDHGYIKLVESWGSDERIIEAARMSTNKGFLGWGCGFLCSADGCGFITEKVDRNGLQCPACGGGTIVKHVGDEKLLRYLYENNHSTPFEMAGVTVEVQAPIFVFREWHRHRVPFGYNEMSARYTPLPDVNYVPTVERLMINSKTNKQAGVVAGAAELTEETAEAFRFGLQEGYRDQEAFYQRALSAGVPKELARVHLPVGRYSRMRATGNLRGWLGFLNLRMAPNAQYEIRMYAEALHDILKPLFPRTLALFDEDKP